MGESRFITTKDGLRLHALDYGERHSPHLPVICLPGLTRTVEAQGKGVKYTFAGVAADGSPIAYGFSVQFDGKDNPVSGSMPSGADTISAKRIDANHYVATQKKGGKDIAVSKVSVSKDGKVTTVDQTGTTASGAKSHDVQVYDKQ